MIARTLAGFSGGLRRRRWVRVACGLVLAVGTVGGAHGSAQSFAPHSPALPNDPSAISNPSTVSNPGQPLRGAFVKSARPGPMASPYTKYIQPGETAPELTAGDKVLFALHNAYTPFSLSGMGLAAGYSHWVNGPPNYGTDSGAFAERVGAAVARDTSEGMLDGAVFAPLLHEDPRYYIEGPQGRPAHRLLHALSGPFVTRTDSGDSTVNGALLLGYGSAALLANAYYPAVNRKVHDTVATFGTSLAGNALADALHEFSGELLTAAHLRKHE